MPWETDLVHSFYGLLGLGAAVALKYFYPSFKKFLMRHSGREAAAHRVDPRLRDDILASLREVLSVPNPPQQ